MVVSPPSAMGIWLQWCCSIPAVGVWGSFRPVGRARASASPGINKQIGPAVRWWHGRPSAYGGV